MLFDGNSLRDSNVQKQNDHEIIILGRDNNISSGEN